VSIVHDLDELHAAYAAASGSGDATVLVERYLAGPQYSVEAMSENGAHVVLAVTRKYSDPQSLVELGHVMPAPLDDEQHAAIAACAANVLDDVGLTFGPSHTEIIVTADGPMPIETHARVGGDDIWLMVHSATGVDLEEVQADQIFAEPVLDRINSILADPHSAHPSQAVWFGATRAEGTFAGLSIPLDVTDDERIEVTALIKPGAPMRPLESSKDRIFKVRAHAASPDEALELARSAAEKVAIASGLPADLTSLAATC
jgi:biotin carboxylase